MQNTSANKITVRATLLIAATILGTLVTWSCTELAETEGPHPSDWAASHSVSLGATYYDLTSCKTCHGETLSGKDDVSGCGVDDCHHAAGYVSTHITILENRSFEIAPCKSCHGTDLAGNENIRGCSSDYCHHVDGYVGTHTDEIIDRDYDLAACESCHDVDGTGTVGVEGVIDCSNGACHTSSGGVFSCDNCHGYTEDDPWVNQDGVSSTTDESIGMHTVHINWLASRSDGKVCEMCHALPAQADILGHADLTTAVVFDSLAIATHDGAELPTWDSDDASCSNVYCHGSFDLNGYAGNDSTWVWNEPVAGGETCGTCHNLPPIGHFETESKCGVCHSTVASSTENTIKDVDLHINGAKDVY